MPQKLLFIYAKNILSGDAALTTQEELDAQLLYWRLCFFVAISENIAGSEAASEYLVEGLCGHQSHTDKEGLGTAPPCLLPIGGLALVVEAEGE